MLLNRPQGFGPAHFAIIRYLLADPRADPNRAKTGGLTPLMNIVRFYYEIKDARPDVIKIFRYLLRCPKVDKDLKADNGASVETVASRFDLDEITEAVNSRTKLLEQDGPTC